MARIVVIGAGFAGVWAAAAAVSTSARHGGHVEVVTVAPNDDLVVRPRLYEKDPDLMRVPLDRVFGPIGVRRLAATVTAVDTAGHQITALDRQNRTVNLAYDKLVIAAGSALVTPDIPGREHLFDVDTLPSAAQLQAHIQALPGLECQPGRFTAVVVGAGFTGLEIATELPARLSAVSDGQPVRVVLIDRGDELAESLGAGPRPQIKAALDKQGVEVRQGAQVAALDSRSVTLADGERIPAATVVWTAGMRASDIVAQVGGERDQLGRLVVDQYLRVAGIPDVFAAGDSAAAHADPDHLVMQSCQHAVPLGRFAGHNVAADLLGAAELLPFAPTEYVTCLDLGPGEAVFTTGWDRQVQMSGPQAKEQKRTINRDWIYPPTDDRDAILAAADNLTAWPSAQ